MRQPIQRESLLNLMQAMGLRVQGPGRIYLTGGATALLYGWRSMTIDVDLKADPEPMGFFEAIADLKDRLSVNIELACPSDFIPEIPGWRNRSRFIAAYGNLEFYHYDPYSQALSKIERSHPRDLMDVESMLNTGWIEKQTLLELFQQIEPMLIRYPSIDPDTFRNSVIRCCESKMKEQPLAYRSESRHHEWLRDLPGGEMIHAGLADHHSGKNTIASCMIRIAAPRLARAGLIERDPSAEADAELALYALLSGEGNAAHSRYNSLLRELSSFEHALDQQLAHAT
jgi:hypothetical protein